MDGAVNQMQAACDSVPTTYCAVDRKCLIVRLMRSCRVTGTWDQMMVAASYNSPDSQSSNYFVSYHDDDNERG